MSNHRLLERDIAIAQTQEIRAIGAPLLRQVIDEAVGIFERTSATAEDGDHNLAIHMPFHHAIEMLDGVEVLLDHSCVAAALPPLRSALESFFGVRYVVSDDTQRRALGYVVADVHERLRRYEEFDRESTRGKQHREDLGEDSDALLQGMPSSEEIREAGDRLRSMLSREPYVEINAEYLRLAQRRNRPPWYSLFGGPANLRELAKRVGALSRYLVLYRLWSKTAHGVDMVRQLRADRTGTGPAVTKLRDPEALAGTYVHAVHVGIDVSRDVLMHYRSGEGPRLAKWYLEVVGPTATRLEEYVQTR